VIGLEGLAPVDLWALLAIAAKATGYGAALLAMGGPLFVAVFSDAPEPVLRMARRVAVSAALIGLAVLALQFGIRAARISGMGLAGATDSMMLGLVWDSPLGTAALWRIAGDGLVLMLLVPGILGLGASLVGAILIAVSFTVVGHSLGDPRWLLTLLLVVHLMAAAFWVGALLPLRKAIGSAAGAVLLHRFGVFASAVVAALIAVGVSLAWFLSGSVSALFATAYGWTLLAKLGLVTGLMGLAALNKWRLVPALAAGHLIAENKLYRSIAIEAVAVALILIATATLTSVTTPPVNL
jgi:putative copper resistance protein D